MDSQCYQIQELGYNLSSKFLLFVNLELIILIPDAKMINLSFGQKVSDKCLSLNHGRNCHRKNYFNYLERMHKHFEFNGPQGIKPYL
jgi:hypothetical protein